MIPSPDFPPRVEFGQFGKKDDGMFGKTENAHLGQIGPSGQN